MCSTRPERSRPGNAHSQQKQKQLGQCLCSSPAVNFIAAQFSRACGKSASARAPVRPTKATSSSSSNSSAAAAEEPAPLVGCLCGGSTSSTSLSSSWSSCCWAKERLLSSSSAGGVLRFPVAKPEAKCCTGTFSSSSSEEQRSMISMAYAVRSKSLLLGHAYRICPMAGADARDIRHVIGHAIRSGATSNFSSGNAGHRVPRGAINQHSCHRSSALLLRAWVSPYSRPRRR